MNSFLLLKIIVSLTFVLFLFLNSHVYAEPTFKTLDFKLTHDPTICVMETNDKTIPEAGKILTKHAENAILDWQTKLKDSSRLRDSWNLEFREIKSMESNSFDLSICDIQIHFKDKPDSKEEQFRVLGETYLDNETLSPIIVIYYLQIDLGLEEKTLLDKDENILYYWEESNPRYLDYLRMDDQLASVIRHELGHAFGLGHYMTYDHSSNENWSSGIVPPSVMIPILPDYSGRVGIAPLDVEMMITLYGREGFGGEQSKIHTSHTISVPHLLKSFESKDLGFSIQYPAYWHVYDPENIKQEDYSVSFQDNSLYPYARIDVTKYAIAELEIPTDTKYLDAIAQGEKDYCGEMTFETNDFVCSDFTILDSKKLEISNKIAYQIKYFRIFIDEAGEVYPTIVIQTEISEGSDLWVIYATTDFSLYSDFASEINSTITSFKIN